MRKLTKHPMTTKAKAMNVSELEKLKTEGHDPNECLAEAVKHSWRGVYPTKKSNGNGGSSNGNGKPSGAQQAAEEFRRLKESKQQKVTVIGVAANG